MFQRVLIANRGEIALRIIRSLKKLGIHSILVASEDDRWALPARQADEVYYLGEGEVAQTYLSQEKILHACSETAAQAVHPGYGFLSENPEFAHKVEEAGMAFLGPTPQQIREFGVKHQARAIAQKAQIPLLQGSEVLADLEEASQACEEIGYPILLKSSSGGGGIGMEVVSEEVQLEAAWERVTGLAAKNFSSAAVFAERFLPQARHIEVQVFGLGNGEVIVLGDRDCSLQRRNQKVIEECPAPGISEEIRSNLHRDAQRLAESISYRSAGTLEFLFDPQRQEYFFLEMNTRLQVEHTVTEEVFGIDLVEAMIRLGSGELPLDLKSAKPQGHALQLRLYAEDPGKGFLPTTGLFSAWSWPEEIRLDTWVEKGSEISSRYDPLLAKVILHGKSREEVLAQLMQSLKDTDIQGPQTNMGLLKQLVQWGPFVQNKHHTKSLQDYVYQNQEIEVLSPGMQSTLQDLPGRLGYWDVGIPPSGPMDSESHRLANLLLGNAQDAATLEMTYSGAKLKFRSPAKIVLTGAAMASSINGTSVSFGEVLSVESGDILHIGKTQGLGQRAYLGIQGGFEAPFYLGSRSTFTLGGFGGLQGRALLPGDILPFGKQVTPSPPLDPDQCQFPGGIPLTDHWMIKVLIGPHGAPEYFLPEDMDAFFSADWTVNFNSSRTGIRLDGPKPTWARKDGGEAGLHPSNIHDNAYAIGSLDFTGDMPVILGPDGPSLGGFVCPAVVIQKDLWILGQVKAGDRIRFVPVSLAQALGEERSKSVPLAQSWRRFKAVIHSAPAQGNLLPGNYAAKETPTSFWRWVP